MTRGGMVALLAACGCMTRTELKPVHKATAETVYVGDKSCMVHDYESATDVPEGAKNLGFVTVPQVVRDGKEDDEATYVAVRKKICELGGDAMSQAAWVKEMDDDRPRLKVNAWALP